MCTYVSFFVCGVVIVFSLYFKYCQWFCMVFVRRPLGFQCCVSICFDDFMICSTFSLIVNAFQCVVRCISMFFKVLQMMFKVIAVHFKVFECFQWFPVIFHDLLMILKLFQTCFVDGFQYLLVLV